MSAAVTNRKRMAESSFTRAVMDTVVDGLITIDERGTINSFNPAAEKIFGYQCDEVVGKNIRMLMPQPHRDNHDGYLKHYLTTGEARIIGIGREVSGQRKDGTQFPLELAVAEMWVGGRRMFVGTVRDITARKLAEEQINRYMRAVERSNQELDDFAYIASHDLKEPLRGLANNAMFLKEDYETVLDQAGVKRLDRIIYLCHRLEKLVNDLLYFSRIGRQEMSVRSVDLNAVIADIRTTMEAAIQDRNVVIIVAEPLPTVVCDVPRITEVFRNLITNGVKYNDSPEKRIEVGSLMQELAGDLQERVFYVRDNGIGIAPEFHKEIFRIFKRLNSEDEAAKGTGVGLTFVQKIIERHSGRIWIESAPGAGSTFYFTLNTAAGGTQ